LEKYFVIIQVFPGNVMIYDSFKSGCLTFLALAECINKIVLDKDVTLGWFGCQYFDVVWQRLGT